MVILNSFLFSKAMYEKEIHSDKGIKMLEKKVMFTIFYVYSAEKGALTLLKKSLVLQQKEKWKSHWSKDD